MNDIVFGLTDLPPTVKGQVLPLPDGDYLVLVNARLNSEQRRETFNHEIRHLLYGHYEDGRPIAELEAEAGERGALLEMIKSAEHSGLPLVVASRPAAPAATAPPAAHPTYPWGSAEYYRDELQTYRRKALLGMLC